MTATALTAIATLSVIFFCKNAEPVFVVKIFALNEFFFFAGAALFAADFTA
jgi:hypothetical protein